MIQTHFIKIKNEVSYKAIDVALCQTWTICITMYRTTREANNVEPCPKFTTLCSNISIFFFHKIRWL